MKRFISLPKGERLGPETDARMTAMELVCSIDRLLSEQLSVILADEKFQALEARWLSLFELVSLPVNPAAAKVKILDVSWEDISHDLNICSTVFRSVLYNSIANRELNTLGGEPFGIIMVDHAVNLSGASGSDGDYDDIYTLELLADLGAKCLCPVILDVAPDSFGPFEEDSLANRAKIARTIESNDFRGWRRLRALSESRFLGLVLNRVRLRAPYRDYKANFIFSEPRRAEGLWGNSGFVFVAATLLEFNRIRWFGFLESRWIDKSIGSAIAVVGTRALAEPVFKHRMTPKTASFLANTGFIPIFHNELSGKYWFAANNSALRVYKSEVDPLIQTTLMVCRIAHFLKVQLRMMVGSSLSALECENRLSEWVGSYCSGAVTSEESVLASKPLRRADVKVVERSSSLGNYDCHMEIEPHYTFSRVSTTVALTTHVGP